MSNTIRHSLPLLAAGQAQKEVTHNEALLAIDRQLQLSVVSRTRAQPPTVPVAGESCPRVRAARGADIRARSRFMMAMAGFSPARQSGVSPGLLTPRCLPCLTAVGCLTDGRLQGYASLDGACWATCRWLYPIRLVERLSIFRHGILCGALLQP
jgi:hypothetical protein